MQLVIELLLETLFIGDGHGHLLLGLDELILHVEDQLVEDLFGILGLADNVVDIGFEKRTQTPENTHLSTPFYPNPARSLWRGRGVGGTGCLECVHG